MYSYLSALAGNKVVKQSVKTKPTEIDRNTFKGLCLSYMSSGDFKRLVPSSQSNQRAIFESCWIEPLKAGSPHLLGDIPLNKIGPAHVLALRDRKADLPGAANNRIKYLRRLFAWAEVYHPELGNPAKKIKPFQTKSKGFHHWTLDEVTKYEAAHPVGTRARVALDLMLYTGIRRSDAVLLGHGHVDEEGWIVFSQAKTGGEVEIPIIPRLELTLVTGPIGETTFLETGYGQPFTAAGFGGKFREWCDQAGLPQCTAHGLRKVMGARLAELGCSDREIMAITGHQGEKEVSVYTKGAQRRILARSAMNRLESKYSHINPEGRQGVGFKS
jgi:integrase